MAVLASGAGTTLEFLIQNIGERQLSWKICPVISDKETAGALQIARHYGIDAYVLREDSEISATLAGHSPDLILLAGYLKKVRGQTLKQFQGKIINTHPSLLPKHGGRGMFGRRVHEAVFNSRDLETGVTIHEVNENYDEGKILLQKRILLDASESVESIERKVKAIEKETLLEFLRTWPEKGF